MNIKFEQNSQNDDTGQGTTKNFECLAKIKI